MPAYHSTLNEMEVRQICGCGVFPIKTKIRGPAPVLPDGKSSRKRMKRLNSHILTPGVDIIDETIRFFRANVLFRNFEVKGPADRTMIYMTLFCQQVSS
jgi:actin related protein 2/3 complex subunit 3